MTNAALQAILNEYGAKVKCIKTSCHMTILNMKIQDHSYTNNDVKFITKNGVDMIEVPDFNSITHNNDKILLVTSDILKLIITENEKDPIDIYRI